MAIYMEEEIADVKLELLLEADDHDDDEDCQYEWSLGSVNRLLERLQSLEKQVANCLENQASFNELVERLESLEKVVWKTHVIGNIEEGPVVFGSATNQNRSTSITIGNDNSGKFGSIINSDVESDAPAYTKLVLLPQGGSSISERIAGRRSKRVVLGYISETTSPSLPQGIPVDESDIQIEVDDDSETLEGPELVSEAEADSDYEPDQSITIPSANGDKDKNQQQKKKDKLNSKGKEPAFRPGKQRHAKSCPKCKYTFSCAWTLKRHFLTAHSDIGKPFSCDLCDAKFVRQDSVWQHQRKKHREFSKGELTPPPRSRSSRRRPPSSAASKSPGKGSATAEARLYCKICHKKFITAARVEIHERLMHVGDDEDDVALDPTIESESPRSLQIVQSLLDKISLTCLVCSLVSKSESDYREHYETDHFSTYLKPFKCKLCEESQSVCGDADLLYSPEEMTEHLLNSHPNPNVQKGERSPCPVCPLIVSQHCHLGRHMLRIHSIGQPMECDKCDETFTKKYVLRCHQIREHGGITSGHVLGFNKAKEKSGAPQTYTCPNCQKTFHRKQSLKDHGPSCAGLKPFLCPDCGQGFGHRSYVLHHQKLVHMQLKRFFCDQCEKGFFDAAHLNRHLKTHANINKKKAKTTDTDNTVPVAESEVTLS